MGGRFAPEWVATFSRIGGRFAPESTYARLTTKRRNKEIAKELEKMLVEKASKKKIVEFVKRLIRLALGISTPTSISKKKIAEFIKKLKQE